MTEKSECGQTERIGILSISPLICLFCLKSPA